MPRSGPPTSGYQALEQDADLSDSDTESESNALISHPARLTSIQPATHGGPTSTSHRRPNRPRSTSTVDIKVINARLERWADQIANKFKFKKGKHEEAPALEILYSVFVPPEGGVKPVQVEDDGFTHELFESIVGSVEDAISKGVDPTLIKQGSSGSYFARNMEGKVVGVFKPKDEEPYGKLNPKMMKWLHRTLFPCFFGRACLIPNLSYISEAAACLLDRQLKTYMVPYTDVVRLSSKAFHYDYWDRRAYYRRRKPFPPKVGSFQVFLQGYQDANIFLRNNPWPDTSYNVGTEPSQKRRRPWSYTCRPGEDLDDRDEEDNDTTYSPNGQRKFVWNDQLKQNFREELEKLVILDYIMRNTDRGLDNWMVRVDYETNEVTVHSKPANMNLDLADPRPSSTDPHKQSNPIYRVQDPMSASSRSSTPLNQNATIKIGAIDNSLAFPWKHPDQWRSFPFGWLFLPVSLIGQPFSQKTRDHFIPLLTSTKWWSETQSLLRKLFEQDTDFKERMFQKQLAVLKGQAWNVVETLKTPDQGPLELTRRVRVHVWDDEMEVPVAVPLRVPIPPPSASHQQEEEMDISSAASAPNPIPDLLRDFSPTRSNLPSSVRLGVYSRNSEEAAERLTRPDHRSVMSFDTGLTHTRRASVGRRGSFGRRGSLGLLGGRDEEEGDLGYSVLDGSDAAKKKVIAERLEAVQTRNPVFTWC